MRIRKSLAVSAAGLSLAAGAVMPAVASAGTHHPATSTHGTFNGKITPKKGIKNGTKVTLKVKKGAEKKTNYLCLFAIVKGTANGPNTGNTKSVTSSSKGAFSCSLTFKPFSESVGSKKVHCPPTKAETKAGYICGFAAADPLHSLTSNTFQHLKFKK